VSAGVTFVGARIGFPITASGVGVRNTMPMLIWLVAVGNMAGAGLACATSARVATATRPAFATNSTPVCMSMICPSTEILAEPCLAWKLVSPLGRTSTAMEPLFDLSDAVEEGETTSTLSPGLPAEVNTSSIRPRQTASCIFLDSPSCVRLITVTREPGSTCAVCPSE
jgi:hypothetical protein